MKRSVFARLRDGPASPPSCPREPSLPRAETGGWRADGGGSSEPMTSVTVSTRRRLARLGGSSEPITSVWLAVRSRFVLALGFVGLLTPGMLARPRRGGGGAGKSPRTVRGGRRLGGRPRGGRWVGRRIGRGGGAGSIGSACVGSACSGSVCASSAEGSSSSQSRSGRLSSRERIGAGAGGLPLEAMSRRSGSKIPGFPDRPPGLSIRLGRHHKKETPRRFRQGVSVRAGQLSCRCPSDPGCRSTPRWRPPRGSRAPWRSSAARCRRGCPRRRNRCCRRRCSWW